MADKRVTELTEKTTVNANDYLIVDNATDGTKKIKVSAISDAALSDSSENPVQNKVVKAALDGKQGTLTAGSGITINEENVISASGGGGGTSDYSDLTNKPQINSVTLSGNKSLADLGAQEQLTFDNAPTENSDNPVKSGGIYSALAGKQATLTFDNAPTASSTNPVTSDGIKTALDAKQDTLTIDSTLSDLSENPVQNKVIKAALDGKQATLTFDNAPTENSDNPVKSGGIYSALAGKQATLTFDNAPTESSDNPVKSGGVYSALAGKQATLTFDNVPTENSDNPVKSGGVYSALAGKQATLTFDNVPTASSTNPVTSDGIKTALDAKQGTLTAGSNITINNNVISASVSVSANEYTKTVNLAYSDSKTIALDMTDYSYAATDSIDVYINGLHGILGTDYTISVSGTSASVVLTLAGTTGTTENIEIIATKYS